MNYLRKMAMRITILCPEHGANLEDFPSTRRDQHLLVQLRGLSQIRLATEVIHFKDVAPTLCGCSHYLGRDDFLGTVKIHVLSEEFLGRMRNTADGMTSWSSQIKDPVVESRIQGDVRIAVGLSTFVGAERGAHDIFDLQG